MKVFYFFHFFQPRTIHVVPPVMVLFAKHPHIDGYDLSSVNRIICGAAPLSAKIEEVVKNKLNLTSVHQGKYFIVNIDTP